MKQALLLATCCTFLVFHSGCGQNTPSTYPPSGGDYVKNSDGRGIAMVWGITFDVIEPVGASAASHFDGSLSSDPENTDARTEIALGDVKIRLEKIPGSPITFQLNGEKHGTLEVGDKVSIDKERNVKVNDSARQSEEDKSDASVTTLHYVPLPQLKMLSLVLEQGTQLPVTDLSTPVLVRTGYSWRSNGLHTWKHGCEYDTVVFVATHSNGTVQLGFVDLPLRHDPRPFEIRWRHATEQRIAAAP